MKRVYVHGWIYELQSGRLKDLGVSRGPEGFVGPKFVGGVGALMNGVNGFRGVNGVNGVAVNGSAQYREG